MSKTDKDNPCFDDITEAWDRAGASTNARAEIHPAGNLDDEGYFESGKTAAQQVANLAERSFPEKGSNIRIVDFGCGDGRILYWLAKRFDHVWGVDASQAMLDRLALTVPGANSLLSNGQDGKIKSIEPDLIYSSAVFIHHDHEAGKKMLLGLAESVDSGGILALQIPCYDIARERSVWNDVTVWTRQLIQDAANEAGVDIVELQISPGSYRPENPGAYHDYPVIMRKR